MNIIVAAATILEIEPLLETANLPPYKLLITGIGSAAAVYSLTRQVLDEKPDLIIQAGMAGSFKQASMGNVYAVEKDRFADMGVEENGTWRDIFDMNLADPNEGPFFNGWLNNLYPFVRKLNLPLATSITINEITTNPSRIDLFKSKYEADLESMEGAALHFVGIGERVPFVQLRAVSNIVGERDKSKWQMMDAIKNLNNELIKLLHFFAAAPFPA